MQKKTLVSILIVLVLIAAALAYVWHFDASIKQRKAGTDSKGVYSFEDCVAAGNPVMESYPRQCVAGKITFVETVPEQANTDAVVFQNIRANQRIESPLEVRGTALGSWFFEANIGLRLLDADGKEVVRGHAEATSDWMTPNPVPFKGTITFTAPATATGFIEVEKDNPSDKRELDASVRIPIRFK